MNPWTALGWLLLAAIAIPITLCLLIGFVELGSALRRDFKASRRRNKANAGRLPCEYHECTNIATRRGASGYVCEEHTHTHLTRRGAVSFAFPLTYRQAGK